MTKNLLAIFTFLSLVFHGYSQDIETYKKLPLGQTEVLTLNSVGGTTFSMGGKQTRNRLAVKIPAMSEFVFIEVRVDNSNAAYDAQVSKEMMQNLMASKASPTTKLVGGATLMALSPPKTGYKCDFFMFSDRSNFNAFLEPGIISNYADNWISYAYPYRRMNSESFNLIVDVNVLQDKNTLYLGLRNNDNLNAIKVFVNVVALVGNGWKNDIKEELYTNLYKNLKSNGFSNEDKLKETCGCFVDRVTKKYTLDEFRNLPEYEQNAAVEQLLKDCNSEFSTSETKSKATTYGNLGWKAFENGDYDKALEYSQKALSIDNSLSYIHFNIALIALIRNDKDAIDKYIDGIQLAKKDSNPQESLKGALDDILNYEKSKGVLSNSSDVKDVLKAEIK